MKTKITISGVEYEYAGVTDLELIPLVNIFGTERPPKKSSDYDTWTKEFAYRYADYASQRTLAHFLRCAFPDIPDSIVKYQVRRLPDGTEVCDPGRDLRVRLSAKEFEQIIDAISPELAKVQSATVDIESELDDDLDPSTEEINEAIELIRLRKAKGFGKKSSR